MSNDVPQKIEDEQSQFLEQEPSALGRGFAAIFRPIGDTLTDALPEDQVIAALQKADAAAASLPTGEISHDTDDLEACREVAGSAHARIAAGNAVSGAAAGMGGAATTLADLPVTLTLALRLVRETGRAFGFEGDGDAESRFRLAVLELASIEDPDERRTRAEALRDMVADDGSLKSGEGDGGGLMEMGIERVARAMLGAALRNRAGAAVPVLGAGVGAAVNASFQGDIAQAARYAFQHRRLAAKDAA